MMLGKENYRLARFRDKENTDIIELRNRCSSRPEGVYLGTIMSLLA